MPPKRKQPSDPVPERASSTRTTRASTKSAASTSKNTAKEPASSSKAARKTSEKASARGAAAASTPSVIEGDDVANGEVTSPPAKRARTAGTRKTAPKVGGAQTEIDDGPASTRKVSSVKEYPDPASQADNSLHVDRSPTVQPKAGKKSAKTEPYSAPRALELFSTYTDSDDPTIIGPEGFEQLCTDAGIPMDGSCPLILAWLMEAKEMAKISKSEWTAGTSTLKISSLASLTLAVTELETVLIEGKEPVKAASKKDQDYDRATYFSHASNPKSAFQKLYQFSFALAKPETSRNIDMETSVAFWTVLLVPKYPIMADIVKFITEKGTYRATNKDLWTMMLEFCETVKTNLENYEADGAWPTLLDDFVLWEKGRTANGAPETEETNY